MQRFEITIDGTAQAGDYASEQEANAAATQARSGDANKGKAVAVRPKAEPSAPDASARAEQGTPGNPAGSSQRR